MGKKKPVAAAQSSSSSFAGPAKQPKSVSEDVVFVVEEDAEDDVSALGDSSKALPDAITSPVLWEDKVHYEKCEDGEDKMFRLEFDRVIVPECTIPLNIQFFLDDTSNGKHGVGNTRFVDLQPMQNKQTGKVHQAMVGVEWWMMGAKDGKIPMPSVGKVVVRGSTTFCFGQNVVPSNIDPFTGDIKDGDVGPKFHGILGGGLFSLEKMLNGLKEKGAFEIPIYNSFLSMNEIDNTLPPGPLKVCEVHLEMDTEKAAAMLKRYMTKKQHLFTASKLPNAIESPALNNLIQSLPGIMNQLFLERIKNGQYEFPQNAPKNFLQLSVQQQLAILDKEPGGSFGRGGSTPSAELYGVHFPHANAALPAMSKEDEQLSITSDLFIVASFYSALGIYAPHGMTLQSLRESMEEGKATSPMLASFVASVMNVAHSLPATQMYGFDNMLFKMPGRAAESMGDHGWVCIAGKFFLAFLALTCLFYSCFVFLAQVKTGRSLLLPIPYGTTRHLLGLQAI